MNASFDDLVAAALLYLDAWRRPEETEGVTQAFRLLEEQVAGADSFTSLERERLFRDAAIRVCAERGMPYAEIGARYCLSPAAVSRIAVGGGIRRRAAA